MRNECNRRPGKFYFHGPSEGEYLVYLLVSKSSGVRRNFVRGGFNKFS